MLGLILLLNVRVSQSKLDLTHMTSHIAFAQQISCLPFVKLQVSGHSPDTFT